MKRLLLVVMMLGLIWGCQKEAEQESQADAGKPAQEQKTDYGSDDSERPPVSPPPRVSEESKIWLTSAECKAGEQTIVDVHYYLNEPAKTIVVPLTYLGNAKVDSFSWVGSSLGDYAMRPVNIGNDLKIFLAAVVPMTEPDIPADTGFLGSIYFSVDKDAPPQTINIETTFVHPGNTLSYVDTLIGLVTPQWESGVIKVTK